MGLNAEQFVEYEQPERPLVILVPEMAEDEFTRAAANRFIGSVALNSEVGFEQHETEGPQTLMEAIHRAAKGDHEALKMVRTNVETDVAERTIKAGHISKVELDVDEQGTILQFGQTMDAVQANSLRFTGHDSRMRQRVEAEARNALRIKQAFRQGLLEDYVFVVISQAPDNMSKDELTRNGFYKTMSWSVQGTTATNRGLQTESAFIAGGSYEQRHDAQSINGLGEQLGVDFSGKNATQKLDMPLLVHKSVIPNGVSDLVAKQDRVAQTFFGQHLPPQDYVEYAEKCKARQASFKPKVDAIVAELLEEAEAIWSPVAATQRLHKISEKHMVEHSITDTSIDPSVFGPAARHIEQARLHMLHGDYEAAHSEIVTAKATAVSSSCPNGASSLAESGDVTSEQSKSTGKKQRMKCPFCDDKNQKGDPCSSNQHCTTCDARVRGGKVVSRGTGRKPKKPQPASKILQPA